MVSERIRRRIEALLDEADAAFTNRDWLRLQNVAGDVLKLDPVNADAALYASAAEKGLVETSDAGPSPAGGDDAPSRRVSAVGRRIFSGQRPPTPAWPVAGAVPGAGISPTWVSRAAGVGMPAGREATLMFSDIEGSTAMNDRLGDERWLELLHEHNAVVEESVQRCGGRVVKTFGDGYMVVFSRPQDGLRCAQEIQEQLRARGTQGLHQPGTAAPPVRVRIGLHTGPVVPIGADYLGREVNYAARVASAADGGEVLVSAAVRERCGSGDWCFESERRVEFKGFEGVQPVWRLGLGEATTASRR